MIITYDDIKIGTINRTNLKTLDSVFLKNIEYGANCPPFMSQAILETAKKVYNFGSKGDDHTVQPGQMKFVGILSSEPAGKALKDCKTGLCIITYNAGQEDLEVLFRDGVTSLRRLRVRTSEGRLEEVVLTLDEVVKLLEEIPPEPEEQIQVAGEELRLLIESNRIRLAYCYDPYFAVSLSGIQSLPHQIEAVYGKLLPQARLRFLLADDPGAGKTIMAGLLVKELKLRNALERVLIIVPAALTIQWQDELLRFFDEIFTIINTENDKQQLINLWQRESQVITSLDYAKRPEVRERVWASNWDLIVLDEAHKCSAYTKRSNQRSPEAKKTMRYQLIEHFSERPALSLLFLTATPHQGDEDRFSHFLHLLDPDLFVEPHKLFEKERELRKSILGLGKDCPWMIRRLKEDLRDFDGKRIFPNRHSQTVTFSLGSDEYGLYHKVNEYLNRFLIGGTGRARQSR